METYMYNNVSICLEVNNPVKYTKLLNFCTENGIYFPQIVSNPFTPLFLDSLPKLPSKSFKHLCGVEWLRSDGKISAENAYTFLLHYVKVTRLLQTDGSIDINPELRELFGTDKHRIYNYELPGLIGKVFM